MKNERDDFTSDDESPDAEPEEKDDFDEKADEIDGEFNAKLDALEQKRMRVEAQLNEAQRKHWKATTLQKKKAEIRAEQERTKQLQNELWQMRTAKARKIGRGAKKVGKGLFALMKQIEKKSRKKPVKRRKSGKPRVQTIYYVPATQYKKKKARKKRRRRKEESLSGLF